MTTHRVEVVRRDYNKWVANETIEDYALRYSPASFRKWPPATIARTLVGTNSALSYEAIAAGIGYVGSTFTSLIYASFTFIFLALETAIMAQAVKLCFGVPLWLVGHMTAFAGAVSGSRGFDLPHFGVAAGIAFALIAQIGEQADYLRFGTPRFAALRSALARFDFRGALRALGHG